MISDGLIVQLKAKKRRFKSINERFLKDKTKVCVLLAPMGIKATLRYEFKLTG
jgi:hypothetical protein